MPHYWPAISIAIIIGFYWARVLRLVFKSFATTGRSANFWPREPLGRGLRLIWMPAIALWIVVPAIVGWNQRVFPGLKLLWWSPALAWTGVAVAVAATGATLVCWKKMGGSWRMGIDPSESTQLIITGPYAYVRHPIYALSSLLMIASMVAVPTIAMLVIGTIHLSFLQWEARREERHLVAKHGAEYERYFRRVGRFIPKSLGGFYGERSDAEA